MKSVHSGQLERWLGPEVHGVSRAMRGWYGPPIAVGNVPGDVYATGDGDFVGRLRAGYEASAWDWAADKVRRVARQRATLGLGFASLTDLLTQAKTTRQVSMFSKTIAGVQATGRAQLFWDLAGVPVAGTAGVAAPGGTAYTRASAGAMTYTNAKSGGSTHVTRMQGLSTLNSNTGQLTVLLMDRLFAVAKTMSSVTTEAVTGVPTRYTNTTAGAVDSASGNFISVEGISTLSATAHNWTVCQYTDESGNTGATLPSLTGVGSLTGGRGNMDWSNALWFAPLATGDTGVLALTQMQCDASVTGAIDFSINHPLAWLPLGALSAVLCSTDGIASAFNLVRVFDDACLTLGMIPTSSGVSGALYGQVELVSGS